MKILILGMILFFQIGCTSSIDSGGGSASGQADPFYGKWQYENPTSTSTKAKGMVAVVNNDGSIVIMNIYAIANGGNAATLYFRKSVGTFSRSGEMVNLKYSYETCNPVGSELLKVKVDPLNSDRMLVSNQDGSIFFTMSRLVSSKSDMSVTAIEDKNCNLISALLAQSRNPASVKSVLDFMK